MPNHAEAETINTTTLLNETGARTVASTTGEKQVADEIPHLRNHNHQDEPYNQMKEKREQKSKPPMCLIMHQTPPVSVAMDTCRVPASLSASNTETMY